MWWTWVARQKVELRLPMRGLRDSFGTWVYETNGVKQAQEWLGHGDPATTLRHYVRLTTAAREGCRRARRGDASGAGGGAGAADGGRDGRATSSPRTAAARLRGWSA
jgi:hypothetical protein